MYDVDSLKLMTVRFMLWNRTWSRIYPAMFFSLCVFLHLYLYFQRLRKWLKPTFRIRLKSSKMYWNLWKSVKQNNTKNKMKPTVIQSNLISRHDIWIWFEFYTSLENWIHCDCLLNFLGDNNLRFQNKWKSLISVLIPYGSGILN